MTHADDILRSDLTALGDDSLQRMPGFDEVARTLRGSSTPYRDDTPGADARRRSLLEDRLRELALLPLQFERVFVHRVSRAAAGAVAVAGVALAVIASSDPWSYRLAYFLVGQPTPALAAAMLVTGVLAAYVAAGLVAERVYERRVRRTVESGDDPFADIEHLGGAGPLHRAARLVDRVDALAVALPVAGVVSGGLLLGLLAFFSDPGYSALGLVAESRGELVPSVLAGVAAGLALGAACRRDRRSPDGSPLVRFGHSWTLLAVAGAVVVVTLWMASRTAFGLHAFGIIPSRRTGMVLGVLGVASLVLPATWAALRLRARELRRLG